MITWIFDVDGVLSDVGETSPPEFRQWFLNWAQDKNYFLVTGSQHEKTIKQVGQDIINATGATFNCLGNSIWINNKEERINQLTLHWDELAWLKQSIQLSKCPEKTGNHIELRQGSVNFSTVGRNASIQQRLAYKQWDDINNERINLIEQFINQFPRFDAYIGGNTSIDICLRGANKGQCLNLILGLTQYNPQTYFFGDRCGPNGIDEPLAQSCQKIFSVSGYKETWEILKTL